MSELYSYYYDDRTHVWLAPPEGGRARCGLDALEAESVGDIVALSFVPVGTRVARGEGFGSLEAAKFVGPLIAPVSVVVRAHNAAALASPGLVNRAPLATWLVELELGDPGELAALLHDEAEIRAWTERERARYRDQGAITP